MAALALYCPKAASLLSASLGQFGCLPRMTALGGFPTFRPDANRRKTIAAYASG
jgi:hypothetical protein